jgi:Flp pilus assembly protein TadG
MNASFRHAGSGTKPRTTVKRQTGATTVEFALTVGLSLVVMFAIIEFAIGMYNQGVLVHGTRVGAREASMYWVDPTRVTPNTNPLDDQRIDADTVVGSITDWTDNFIVSLNGNNPNAPVVLLNGSPLTGTPVAAHGDEVRVDTTFQYVGPITSVLANAFAVNQRSRAIMRVE